MDLFEDKAEGWDARPVPAQISDGVFTALQRAFNFAPGIRVLDFGAGTGLLTGRIAPLVDEVVAVDVSRAMLAQLAKKTEIQGKVSIVCQDLLDAPLDPPVDVVVSAMAAHHVQDTAALFRALYRQLKPGGRLGIADLDAEDGTFHPPGVDGVFHAGFDRDALARLARDAGFVDTAFVTATEVHKDGRTYPIFLMTATRPPTRTDRPEPTR